MEMGSLSYLLINNIFIGSKMRYNEVSDSLNCFKCNLAAIFGFMLITTKTHGPNFLYADVGHISVLNEHNFIGFFGVKRYFYPPKSKMSSCVVV